MIETNRRLELPDGELLLVEDDAGDALLVGDLLDGAGSALTTVWVTTLSEVAAALTEKTVCILLDLGLPDGDGLDGLRRVLAAVGDIPVVVLTGFSERGLGEEAVSIGAQDYLVKGVVDGEGLRRAIRYAIERKIGELTSLRLHEVELVAAERARLERGLLPRPIIANPALRWATRYRPGGERALLGGDFYDGVELPDGSVRILIGDVAGHGPDEAALGVALRVAWRALVLGGCEPDAVLRHVQTVLCAERYAEDVFATVCDVTLHPGFESADVRLAGHPGPLVVYGSDVRELELTERGPVLGVVDEPRWPPCRVELGNDWVLILLTDGIIETRAARGDQLDVAMVATRAVDTLVSERDLGGFADRLIAGSEEANRGPLRDDVALFLLANGPRWRD